MQITSAELFISTGTPQAKTAAHTENIYQTMGVTSLDVMEFARSTLVNANNIIHAWGGILRDTKVAFDKGIEE